MSYEIKLHIEHRRGDTVVLKTDVDKRQRIVTAYRWQSEEVEYLLSCGTEGTWHQGIEIKPPDGSQGPGFKLPGK